MSLGTLDVLLGLVLVYAVLSILCTACNEIFAQTFDSRARRLERSLHALLSAPSLRVLPEPDDPSLASQLFATLWPPTTAPPAVDPRHVSAFAVFEHPMVSAYVQRSTFRQLIRGTRMLLLPGRLGGSGSTGISYVPPKVFALVLLDLILGPRSNGAVSMSDYVGALQLQPEYIRRQLLILAEEAGSDVATFRSSIERWFSDAMDRASEHYKRGSQLGTIVLAIVFTVLLNADTFRVMRLLSSAPAVRGAMADFAQRFVESMPGSAFSESIQRADSAGDRPNSTQPPTTSIPAKPIVPGLSSANRASTEAVAPSETRTPLVVGSQSGAAVKTLAPTREQSRAVRADTSAAYRMGLMIRALDSVSAAGILIGWSIPDSVRARWTNELEQERSLALAEALMRNPTDTARATALARDAYVSLERRLEWRFKARETAAHMGGLLLTILAISLGAPFWFDLLSKLVTIRSVGKKPAEQGKG